MEKDLKYWIDELNTWKGINKHLTKNALYNINVLKSIKTEEVIVPKKEVVVEKKVELDLNSDGKIDKKDASLAGKVLAKVKSIAKGKRSKKK